MCSKYSNSQFGFVLLVMPSSTSPLLVALQRRLGRAQKKRDREKAALLKTCAEVRVVSERIRSETRRIQRALLRKETGRKKAAPRSGHRERFPGMCFACMKRRLGEPGGPRHTRQLCVKTQRFQKRFKTQSLLLKWFESGAKRDRK